MSCLGSVKAGKRATYNSVLTGPTLEIQHGGSTPVHLHYGKRKREESKPSKHLNFKSSQGAFARRKRCTVREDLRITGFWDLSQISALAQQKVITFPLTFRRLDPPGPAFLGSQSLGCL